MTKEKLPEEVPKPAEEVPKPAETPKPDEPTSAPPIAQPRRVIKNLPPKENKRKE